ncbi:MAG TPA: serine hydrolase domain-containing protein, partial [Thermomonas sp.]|nr:serine hydrolase domain-containing protein [Thermomonas sp.]
PESAVDAIFKRYDSKDTPGCSVAVIDGGKLLLKKSYGMADPSLGVPRTSATSHWIPYSEARVFVALAVAMLARDGKIELDDPIRQHIPQVPSYASAVTVRQLLHHTSGLADYGVLDPGFDSMWSRVSEDELFRVLARWSKLGFAPGAAQMYSNTDYALLEMLVARVSGGSLHDYLHGKLLGPLGMNNTRIGASQTVVRPGHALFYEPDGDGFQRVFPYRTSPVGGISVTTSLDDLIRWNAALRNPKSGLASMLKQLESGALAPGADAEPGTAGYSFGVFRRSYRGLPLVEYHGVGNYTYLVQVDGTALSVATLCNTYPGMDTFGAEVARLYAASPDAATTASPTTVATTTPPPKVGPPIKVATSELQRYVGEYRGASGQLFDITASRDALVFTPRGRSAMPPMLPVGGGLFRTDIGGSTYLLTFKDDGDDMVMSAWDVTANESGGEDLRRRAQPTWANAAKLAEYAGTYVGDDVDATLYVRVDGNRILMATRGRADIAMTPEGKPDHFDKWDIYRPRFERDANGRVVALILDATRVKGIRYTKR